MSQQPPLTIEQAISQAKKAIKQGKVAVAMQLYNGVLQHYPNHPVAKKGLRKLQKSMSRNKSVQIQKIDPPQNKIDYLVNLYQSGQTNKAEQICFELLRTYPKSFNVYNILGAALNKQRKLQEAIEALDHAIQLNPDYAEAYRNRGVILSELGHFEEAVESYDKAIQLMPNYIVAYTNRGNAKSYLGDLSAAIDNYKEVLKTTPHAPTINISLAVYSWIDGDLDKMDSYLSSIKTLDGLTDKEINFVSPYRKYLSRLLSYKNENYDLYASEEELPVLYIIGESHCLAASNAVVNFNDKKYRVSSKIIIGCKAWHLANDLDNRYKSQLEIIARSIPGEAPVIITFGEIDCRIDEGIIKFHRKANNNIEESIHILTKNYVDYVSQCFRGHTQPIVFSGVPAVPVLPDSSMEDDAKILSETITTFNSSLMIAVSKRKHKFLDLYSMTENKAKESFIDERHLFPSVFIEAVSSLLV